MAQVTLREYLQEIEDALGSGRVDEAAKDCQHVLTQFPESLEVQRLLGEVYLAQGHTDEAQQALDWILTNDPENVIAYCDRALISERTSDFDTALDCYQQAYELSRGNRHIRQQFNMLSAKTGQQGFMFSRAGLARLYMRGGLLPQATQEWDAVLAVSPDRLDARTGLLETYWREEMYDEAEQVALQALRDVPGCVKALLILAHITAPRDMQQAKEYVQRAQMLDPDLSMAQELFEDMMMSQPGHPFLKLLNKAPSVVETGQSANKILSPEPVFAQVPVSEGGVVVPDALLNGTSTSNSPFDWNTLDTWNSGGTDTLTPDSRQQSASDPSLLPTWSHDTFGNNEAWTLPEQTEQEQKSSSSQSSDDFQLNGWSMPPVNNGALAPEQQEASAWNDDLSHLTPLDSEPIWQQETALTDNVNPSWMSAIQEPSTSSAPPSWLSMLTPDEQKPAADVPEQTQPVAEEVVAPSALQQTVETKTEDETSDASWHEALQSSLNAPEVSAPEVSTPKVDDDEEGLSFGPAWLKSIGATEIGAEMPEQSAQPSVASATTSEASVVSPEPSPVAESEPTQNTHVEPEPAPVAETQPTYDAYAWLNTSQSTAPETQADTHDWSQYLSPEPEMTEQPEQTVVNTLESLEDSLRSQGFVPLEPNTLSAIAQSQEQEPANEELQLPEEVTSNEEPYQLPYSDDSTLSSALAQLGNFTTPYTQPAYPSQELVQSAAHETSTTNAPDEEPSWMSQLRSVPAPSLDTELETRYTAPKSVEVPGKLAFDSTPTQQYVEPQEQVFPNSVEVPSAFPAFEPSYTQPQEEAPLAPTGRDAFFESELETTMKRPAVRLQAMSRRTTAPLAQQTTSRNGDGRTMGASGNSTRNFQERLIKGYQHQLVGDYDEAMQEYRVIIKSAPELLDDVVSNVRALLKLAPNYSAGYRVLGDAYMRQGEYLQAMEAYNKALTMAKKAKV